MMRKSKSVYMNYVCPYCWHTLNNCTCDLFPPYHTIFIDKNIQEHVRILNEKGYRTIGCCEGHLEHHKEKKGSANTHIICGRDYFKETGIPEGFKYCKRGKGVIYDYSSKLTNEQFEEIKKENLAVLLEWIKSLPNRNIEN